jgi:hypothetical protein
MRLGFERTEQNNFAITTRTGRVMPRQLFGLLTRRSPDFGISLRLSFPTASSQLSSTQAFKVLAPPNMMNDFEWLRQASTLTGSTLRLQRPGGSTHSLVEVNDLAVTPRRARCPAHSGLRLFSTFHWQSSGSSGSAPSKWFTGRWSRSLIMMIS